MTRRRPQIAAELANARAERGYHAGVRDALGRASHAVKQVPNLERARRAARFFDRHPLLAMLAGLPVALFLALLICYLAVPDTGARTAHPHFMKGNV